MGLGWCPRERACDLLIGCLRYCSEIITVGVALTLTHCRKLVRGHETGSNNSGVEEAKNVGLKRGTGNR